MKISEIDDMVGELNSYAFPLDNQKMLLVLMAMTQKPFRFSVFGSIEVGRESFKSVSSFDKSFVDVDVDVDVNIINIQFIRDFIV